MRKEKTEHPARLPFAASMLIFGTIGLLRRFIDLPSGVIACFPGCWAAFCCCFCSGWAGKSRAWLPSGSLFCRCSFPAA